MITKDELLNIGVIEDNEYLDKYIQLIIENECTKKQKYKTQKHHIIPRCYYKHKNISVDNSSHNLVNLFYKDHILAHYYLCLCITDEDIKHDCVMAFTYLTDRIDSLKTSDVYNLKIDVEYSRDEIVQQLPKFQELYEQAKKTHGEKMRGSIPWNKGTKSSIKRIAINDGVSTKYVMESELQSFLDNGWKHGRHNQHQFMQATKKANTGRIPYNKGTHLTDEQKEYLRQINIGKKQSVETIEKRREKLIGRIVSEETKQKIKNSNIGKTKSDEAKLKMSIAKKGKPPPNKGKPMPEQQREQQSKDRKGRVWVTNGVDDKIIKTDEYPYYESIGFYKGRSHTNNKKGLRKHEDQSKT